MARAFNQTQDTIDFIKAAPDANADEIQQRLETVLKRDFPTAEVLNQRN